jgi:hypothetical protein
VSHSSGVVADFLPDQVAESLAESRSVARLRAALELLLAEPRDLFHWLQSLLDDPERLTAVVDASYWHANGFAKLVLHSATDFRIRLHVWPAGPGRRGESDPHSHRWDFASTVLVGGGLAITEWQEQLRSSSAADLECTRYTYDGFALVPDTDRQYFLKQERQFAVVPGTSYETTTSTIHTVVPVGSDLVASLLVQGPHVNDATAVYGTDLVDVVDRPGHAISTADVRELVSRVIATR